MKRFLSTAAAFVLPALLMAQSDLGYNTAKYGGMRLSSAQTAVDWQRAVNFDIENSMAYATRDMGAPVDFMLHLPDSTAFRPLRRHESNVVEASFSNVNNTGMSLHYDGRRSSFGNVLAGGQLSLKGAGTLYGMAAYSNGGVHGVALSYTLHPEDVAPYFVSDSLGASTMRREIYTVVGGYSLQLGQWALGTDALYEGIAQSRNQAPRHTNYAHLIRIGLSGARMWRRDMASLKITPEWSRQAISANSMQEGVRFFDFYGFGLYNRRESQGAISYARQQTIRGVGAQALYMHGGAWHVMLDAGWRYRRLNTEEYNFRNLFASSANHFWQQVVLTHANGPWTTMVQLSAWEQKRKGEENVYEQEMQDLEQGLYDYVKVATNKLYTLNTCAADIRVKERLSLSDKASVFVLGAAAWQHYEEKYKSPLRKITNQTLTATIASGVSVNQGSWQMESVFHAAVQGGWDNECSLAGATNTFQQDMAITPYELRGENHQELGLTLLASHGVGKGLEVGVKAAASYINSDYRKQMAVEAGVFLTF